MNRSGWRPSTYDGRDLQFAPAAGQEALPPRVELDHPFRPRDQRNVPCCVSVAIATAMEIIDQRRPPSEALSPLFHYHVARTRPSRLELLDFRTALQAASSIGICRARYHSSGYDADGAALRPSEAAFRDAERQRLVGFDPAQRRMQYESVSRSDAVPACRAALAMGYPVIVGFWMTSAYGELSGDQPVHRPRAPEPSSEGHAVVAVGYDDALGAVRIKDSRGTRFADGGSWWLPYAALESTLIHEIWVLRRITYD